MGYNREKEKKIGDTSSNRQAVLLYLKVYTVLRKCIDTKTVIVILLTVIM